MRLSAYPHLYRIITCIILAVCLLLPALAAPRNSSKRAQLLKRKTSIQHRITQVRRNWHQAVTKERQTKKQLNRVEARLRSARHQLVEASRRFERARVELHRANIALVEAKRDYTSTQNEAEARLLAMYERGTHGNLELLLTTKDVGHFLERAQLIQYIVDEDRRTLESLRDRREKVANYQHQVQSKTREVATRKQQVAVLHNLTDLERRRTSNTLSDAHSERMALQAELDALQRDSAAVSSMLRSLQTSAAGRRRYNTTYAGPVSGMPVRGRITSNFGYRVHPIHHTRRLHTGVDIAAPSGTPVHVTGGGEVVYAGWRGGYGNAVIVDHGRGKATLYGHMSSIAVGAGQRVSRNQVVGRVGSTGVSTGPHLHYEVRMNGQPISPF